MKFKTGELSKQLKARLLLIGFVIFVVGYIYLLFAPALFSFLKYSTTVRQLKNNIDTTIRDYKNFNGLKERLEGLSETARSSHQKLVREEDLPQLLEELSSIARDCDVTITLIKPMAKTAPKAQKAGYLIMPIEINALSGYHELGKFVNQLENHVRVFKISDLKIKQNPASDTMHNAVMLVETYTLK